MLALNSSFKTLDAVQFNTLWQTAGDTREALDRVDGDLYGQMVARAYHAAAADPSDPLNAVEKCLTELRISYAHHVGAEVSHTKSGAVRITGDKFTAKARNSFDSAKSVLLGALKMADAIGASLTDGGTVYLRGDGMPRGKTEMQGLIKRAKSGAAGDNDDATETAPLQRALARAADAFKIASGLDESDRRTFLDMLKAQTAQFEALDPDYADDEDTDTDEDVAEAA